MSERISRSLHEDVMPVLQKALIVIYHKQTDFQLGLFKKYLSKLFQYILSTKQQAAKKNVSACILCSESILISYRSFYYAIPNNQLPDSWCLEDN